MNLKLFVLFIFIISVVVESEAFFGFFEKKVEKRKLDPEASHPEVHDASDPDEPLGELKIRTEEMKGGKKIKF